MKAYVLVRIFTMNGFTKTRIVAVGSKEKMEEKSDLIMVKYLTDMNELDEPILSIKEFDYEQ